MVGILLSMAFAAAPNSAASLELFPNFHTMGVNVTLSTPDPEFDAGADLEYRADNGPYLPGFPLSRVDNALQRLSGCLFWCTPGHEYEVRVTLRDRTTPALDGVVLEGKVFARKEPTFPTTQTTLHASPTGQGHRFTRTQPGSLVEALASVRDGQRIVLLEGRYYVGDLQLKAGGSVDHPLVIEGVSSGKVILDGSDPRPIAWRGTETKGLYVTETAVVNPNLVLADGVRLYPHQSMADLTAHKIAVGLTLTGIVRHDANLDGCYRNPSTNPLLNADWRFPARLYVKFRDGSDPARKKMTITRHNRGLSIVGRSHIRLRHLHFAHYGRAPAGTALHLADCTDVVLDNCLFGVNDIGVLLEGDCRQITIQDSRFFDAMAGWHAWKMKATYDDFAPYSAIFPYYARMLERGGILYQHGFRGRGIVVRRCRFHDFAQAGHLGPPSRNDQHPDSYEIDFHDNQVWNCTEDGFELDGDARNVRIWGNVFHHCNASLSLAVAQGGPIYIVRNLFHSIVPDIFTIRPEQGLLTQPGHPFKFQTGDANSRVGDLFFLHNTVVAPGRAVGLDLVAPAKWKRFFARNNLIVCEDGEALQVQSFVPCPIDLDYNGYFLCGRGRLATVDTNTQDGQPAMQAAGLKDLQRLGWETHGQLGDPQFADAARHDYRLQRSSPALDRGVLLPGINQGRFVGRAPDLGAFEVE